MGYQALLFCPDEKLARVVSQVFGELEFTIEAVNEPFGAVKKLMAQHYDAIVVDCNNEQSTSLLFKSARHSSFNQGSLAIALVEGQAGVAKAYRMGANLVLTKPINVEQAKGTLRVARGLLRKNFDAATAASHSAPASPAAAAPASAAWPAPADLTAKPMVPAPTYTESPAFETQFPAMAASAQTAEEPTVAPAPVVEVSASTVAPSAKDATVASELVSQETAKTEAPKPVMAGPVLKTVSISLSTAAAPAPAKEVSAPASKEFKKETEEHAPKEEKAAEIAHEAQPQPAFVTSAPSFSSGPAFAALASEDAGARGRRRRLFIVGVAVLALAAAGYFGWTKLGTAHRNNVPQPTTPSPQKTEPTTELGPPTPASSAVAAPSNRASAATPVTAVKASPPQSDRPMPGASSATRSEVNTEPEAKKPASTPLLVKSSAAGLKGHSQTDEPSSQLPSPLSVGSAGDTELGGLIASPSSSARPVLAQIRVSQGVSQGLLIKRVQPKYPANALAARAQGAVQIEATINKEGKVVSPKVLSGDPVLAAAALEAVRQWRYKPYYLDGEPVEIQTQITINFKLN